MQDNSLYKVDSSCSVTGNGEVVGGNSKKEKDFAWTDPKSNPKREAARIFGNSSGIIFNMSVDKIENHTDSKREAERLALFFINFLGPGNILYKTKTDGVFYRAKYATDEDIAEYFQITERKARELMRKCIKSGLIRELSGKSVVTNERIYIYFVNPCVVTYRSRIATITYYMWEDILDFRTEPKIKSMFSLVLLNIYNFFEPQNDKDVLIKDFLISKIKK